MLNNIVMLGGVLLWVILVVMFCYGVAMLTLEFLRLIF